MSNNLSGISSLSYQGTNAATPPNTTFHKRDPIPTDYQNFSIGDFWINTLLEDVWILVSLAGNTATWVRFAGSISNIEGLMTGDGNTVTPINGIINISGSTNIATTGTVGPNTVTIGLTGITNHNVQIGGPTDNLVQVSPSSAPGIPLISQGSSSDPIFGTVVVAGGGTGDTSFTAYSVITGGTTSTSPLQNVSGVGTLGQILTSNGAGALPSWQSNVEIGAIKSIHTQVFTTTGTYTPTTNMKYCIIEVVGGGGGGGGADTGSMTLVAASTGGGGGGYARGTYSAASIGASQSVTIGAGGAGGAAGPNNGGVGGTTSVGVLLSATGGSDGTGSNATAFSVADGGIGGVGSGGDFQTNGGNGIPSLGFVLAGVQYYQPGDGGSTFFGGGALSTPGIHNSSSAGLNGPSYGGGGSGAGAGNAGSQPGGNGAPGIVIVTEFVG